jgi:intein/homing endonuclease
MRKNGEKPVEYVHPALEPILKKTQGILVFQEQAIQISRDIAGFTLAESETLRKCVTDDTMFLSKTRGWITIKEILEAEYKNDSFLSIHPNMKEFVWVQIYDIWLSDKKEVHEIVLNNGMSIACTHNHKIYSITKGGFIKSKDSLYNSILNIQNIIEGGDQTHIYNTALTDTEKTQDLYTLVGAIVYSGYYFGKGAKDKSFFSHCSEHILSEYSDLYLRVFGKKPTFYNKNQLRIGYAERQRLAPLLQDCAKSATKKYLPRFILGADIATINRALGFILSCGLQRHAIKNSVYIIFKSKKLAKQMQLLLSIQNIYTKIVCKKAKESQQYRMIFDDVASIYKISKDPILSQYMSEEMISNIGDLLSNTKKQRDIDHGAVKEIRPKFGKQNVYDFTVDNLDRSRPREQIHWIIANGMVIHNSIGKKLPKLMAEIETTFIDKCKSHGVVDDDSARAIWDNIKRSQRYSFNLSHSVAYAHIGYYTAYYKANYPLEFFKTYLKYAKERLDPKKEKKELIDDCKRFSIKVLPPSIITMESDFHIHNGCIRFGLRDIRGVGDSVISKLREAISNTGKNITQLSWLEFLCLVATNVNKTGIENMIKCGSLPFNMTRTLMCYEYSKWQELSNGEQTSIITNCDKYQGLLDALHNTKSKNKNRQVIVNDIIKSLESPPYSMEDTIVSMANDEEKLLGIAVSVSELNSKDISIANSTCADYNNGIGTQQIAIACQISRVSEYEIRAGKNTGQKMLFINFFDETGMVDGATMFGDKIAQYGDLLVENNSVIVVGNRTNFNNKLTIMEVIQI